MAGAVSAGAVRTPLLANPDFGDQRTAGPKLSGDSPYFSKEFVKTIEKKARRRLAEKLTGRSQTPGG